ncbi:MAG TPA: F0F1 ATP synthase subunit delta [Clostridia bacterium]|nr:F0F1 ATP synthase subunit delta [Clostridia bacterium]
MPLIEKRYAEALINLSVQKKEIDAFEQDFQSIVDIFNDQEDFRFFLLSPEISTEVKKGALKEVFGGSVKPELLNFLMLVLDKGRIKFLPGIFEEFISLADKEKNVLSMTIISTSPLSEDQIKIIKDKYQKIYNASSVKVALEIDTGILGGIKIKIGDEVVDGSIKGRLDALRNVILSK